MNLGKGARQCQSFSSGGEGLGRFSVRPEQAGFLDFPQKWAYYEKYLIVRGKSEPCFTIWTMPPPHRPGPEAAQAAVTAMTEEWGNPSSRYAFGQEASGRLKEHRAQVAAGLGCRPEEVYFLSLRH